MTAVQSFDPVSRHDARILVLGSMPGVISLQQQQYYAHPRNAFWPIMSHLFGFDADLPYAERCRFLMDNGVAVWDVLKACKRPGSLDASIVASTMVVNDFPAFLLQHPGIGTICFNGATAEKTFLRHARPGFTAQKAEAIRLLRLPSTSPAHAAMRFEEKLAAWLEAFRQAMPTMW